MSKEQQTTNNEQRTTDNKQLPFTLPLEFIEAPIENSSYIELQLIDARQEYLFGSVIPGKSQAAERRRGIMKAMVELINQELKSFECLIKKLAIVRSATSEVLRLMKEGKVEGDMEFLNGQILAIDQVAGFIKQELERAGD